MRKQSDCSQVPERVAGAIYRTFMMQIVVEEGPVEERVVNGRSRGT
jgi:hypothetical protein